MAGLLAWAADVVGGHSSGGSEGDEIPLVFTEDQKNYVQELDRKATNLSRTIEDLRLRLPPPDISQRLPHLFAHSLASNAALALQLNAHSATKEQAQLREVTLQEENAAYEKAISNCKNKVQERIQEAALLQKTLQELDETEKHLRGKLKSAENVLESTEQGKPIAPEVSTSAGSDIEAEKSALVEKLENKKIQLSSMEEIVEDLERKWTQIHDNALKQPTPAQREKSLDKQLHSLIEQLAAKQAQAEGLVSEVHMKEMELERLNGLWRRIETSNAESNSMRNRFGGNYAEKGFGSFGLHVEKLPYSSNAGTHYEKLMLLRSGFVLYIFLLHILVFIKISF